MPFLDTTSTATSSGPFSGVSDFFSSGYFTAFVRVVALFAIAMWLALAFWTAKDARRRIDDPVIVAVCVAAAVLFGPLGVIIYLLLRPPEYLEDVHERELEIQAMRRRLGADSGVPVLPQPGRSRLPLVPALRHQAEERLPPLQGAARSRLAPLPVLRDRRLRCPPRRPPAGRARPGDAAQYDRSISFRHA